MYVFLEDLKKHLLVDHNEDDAYIVELEKVAEDSIATYLQAPLSSFCDDTQCPHETLKPAIRHAIRLLVGTWYANRENVTFATPNQLPCGVNALLMPLKKY